MATDNITLSPEPFVLVNGVIRMILASESSRFHGKTLDDYPTLVDFIKRHAGSKDTSQQAMHSFVAGFVEEFNKLGIYTHGSYETCYDNEYFSDKKVIQSLFAHTEITDTGDNERNKIIIKQRLAIIDNFYSTNANGAGRMFVIDGLAQAICSLGTDAQLAEKATAAAKIALDADAGIKELFDGKYGYSLDDAKDSGAAHCTSLISKYLFFLVDGRGDAYGFPIYDRYARVNAAALAYMFGFKQDKKKIEDMERHIDAIKSIINELQNYDPELWTLQNPFNTQCDLLDHIIWRIGKIKNNSVSLLVREADLKQGSKAREPLAALIKSPKRAKGITLGDIVNLLVDNLVRIPFDLLILYIASLIF
ncbi:MAG: hypothetical protein ACI30K_05785 [Muribaculaceae bacterium]